jgi:hypothetical protein
MNSRSKFLLPFGLLGLLCFTLPSVAQADTAYTYTGNAYTSCTGAYASGGTCVGDALSITFDTTLTGSALDNLPLTDITPYVSSFSFSDGVASSTQADGYLQVFQIATDSSGDIIEWVMSTFSEPGGPSTPFAEAASYGGRPTGVNDYGRTGPVDSLNPPNTATNQDDPGTWSGGPPATTPEPSALPMVALGLAGLLGVAPYRKWRLILDPAIE